ncbi:MAG: cob(I)yrinic acid a,c-diamide adenosyltransferase [Syntrophaceae bacterium]|nr:cob(I)yrinic acid a,c-diamide adenosyltransferase [Syntrophaceae bacterium]
MEREGEGDEPVSNDRITEAASRFNRGLVMVLTGNGKGKTTSAMGQALRAVGHGRKVLVIQFMKGRKYGEVLAAEKHLPGITIVQSGLDSFVMRDNPAPVDVELARQGLEMAREALTAGTHDMVILDEINVAIDFKLIPLPDLLDLIRNKPPEVDLILTGRYAPPEIVELADTVSEIREVRHHYSKGIKERAGIEY